jgi:hypothetical protein
MSTNQALQSAETSELPTIIIVGNFAEMRDVPREQLITELQERISRRGDEFCGCEYEVKLGQCDNNVPQGFSWKKKQSDQEGFGFTFRLPHTNGVPNVGRHYALKSNAACMETFARLGEPTTVPHGGTVVSMRDTRLPKMSPKLTILFSNDETAAQFFKLLSEEYVSAQNRIWPNKAHDIFTETFGSHPKQAIGQYLRQMCAAGFLVKSQASNKPSFSFGVQAVEWLPEEAKQLAPRSVNAAAVNSPALQKMSQESFEAEVRRLMNYTEQLEDKNALLQAENTQLKAVGVSGGLDDTKVLEDTAELYAMFEQAVDQQSFTASQLESVTVDRDEMKRQLATMTTERDDALLAAQQARPDTAAITSDLLARAKAKMST